MELKIRKNIRDEILEIKARGMATALNADALIDAAKSEMRSFKDIVIDASELSYISSAGIRQLILLNTVAQSKGGKLRIVNMNEKISAILEETGLLHQFMGEESK